MILPGDETTLVKMLACAASARRSPLADETIEAICMRAMDKFAWGDDEALAVMVCVAREIEEMLR